MDMKERMHQELLYLPDDEEIMEEQVRCQELLYDYNRTRPSQKEERNRLLLEMFAELGEMPTSAGSSFILERIYTPTIT